MTATYIAGAYGMVGRALARICTSWVGRPHAQVDLRNPAATLGHLQIGGCNRLIMAAGTVGGINYNAENQAQMLMDNTQMALNVLWAASHTSQFKKVLYLGSSCIYPPSRDPIAEDALLSGRLEPTNEGYALAKIVGVKLCQYLNEAEKSRRFIAAMPCNLYGPHDRFDEKRGHVVPSLIKRFHVAKETGDKYVTVWGSGMPWREFLYVGDLAEACFIILDKYKNKDNIPINVGSGEECPVAELATLIAGVVGYRGKIRFDVLKPGGPIRKVLESSQIRKLGWSPKTKLQEGLEHTYAWAVENGKL